MSNLAGWKLAVAALVVGGGTYLALEWLKPYHHPEVKLEGLVPADAVFNGAAAPATDTAAAGDNTVAASNAPAAAPIETKPAPVPEAAVPPPAPEPAPAPAAVVAKPAPPVAVAPAPAPAVKPVAPPPAPLAKAEPAKAKPVAKPSKPAEATPAVPATAWWQSSSSGFAVVYAGSAAFKRALVVMANAPFASADSANQAIKVLDAAGKPVNGHWELNSVNPSMLVFPVSSTGIYQVQIGAALSDRQNRPLDKAVQGPIQVR